jgi:hypothetical protein
MAAGGFTRHGERLLAAPALQKRRRNPFDAGNGRLDRIEASIASSLASLAEILGK